MLNYRILPTKSTPFLRIVLLIALPLCLYTGCGQPKQENPDPTLTPALIRFEQRLEQAARHSSDSVGALREKFPLVYALLVEEMLGIGPAQSDTTARYLFEFQRDPYIDSLCRDVAAAFPPRHDPLLNDELPRAIARFRLAFQADYPKTITTFLSGFRYQAALDDSGDLLIGLDTYLGSQYRYYPTAPYLYTYQIARMSRPYLLPDALRLLLQDQLPVLPSTGTLLDEMVAAGKVHFVLQQWLPGVADSIVFRYTASQADWAARHEKDVWQFLVGEKRVYSTEMRAKSKFMDDGPATLELDPASPPRLGEWLGTGIVARYMQKHPNTPLPVLFQKTGAEIFKDSGYRGER